MADLKKGYTGKIKLFQSYRKGTHDYLYGDVGNAMFEPIADWIIQHECKSIIEPGCGMAHINHVLRERGYDDYTYLGYDTCQQTVADAASAWESSPHINIFSASWHDDMNEDCSDVDCLLMMGILAYGVKDYGVEDINEVELYQHLVNKHKPRKRIMIRETSPNQTYVYESNELHAIDQTYFENICDNKVELNLEMWLGKKILYDIPSQ